MDDTEGLAADVADDVLELDAADAVIDGDDSPGDDGEETVISFADEDGSGEEDNDLVKRLRKEIRERDKRLAAMSKRPADVVNADPEPTIPPRQRLEDFDFDQDKLDQYDEQREAARDRHTEWKVRQAEQKVARDRAAHAQAEALEKQRRALGVGDYEEQAAKVHDRLTEQQIAILVSAADDPARLIYALGRSETKLDLIAGEENLAKFAAQVGKLEKDIKVAKRKAPAPEGRIVGATASTAMGGSAKRLAALKAKAEQTGDYSEYFAAKRAAA